MFSKLQYCQTISIYGVTIFNRKLLMAVGIFFWSCVTLAGSFVPNNMFLLFLFVGLIEVLSIAVRPVALMFRLYGNVYAGESMLETLMTMFLKDPTNNARTFGSGRKMPNMNLTDEETRAVIAFLKWMSSIDTNGFPYNFPTIEQEG